ncbi:MAG: hypothetical protein ACI8SE_001417, partial [Bacteroidia bacterium]
MTAIRVFLLISAMVVSTYASAQLELAHAPKDGAFLPQNVKSKSANYLLTGVVSDVSYSTLYVNVYQSGKLMSRSKARLVLKGSQYTFNQMVFMPAGKYIYKIRFQLIGKTTITHDIDDLVVGDVFLIQGQSNAVAASYNKFDQSYYDTYCRSFGSSSTNGAVTNADTNWYRTYADGSYTRGSVGQWGAVMAKVLVDSFSVPICLINGAVGGTRITQHQRDPSNPTNLSTIYGRLLYRVQKAHFDQNIRGILYFQGESDGGNAVLHDTLFQKLHSFWKMDYPSFEKLYVIQVRSGCGGPSIQLRDKQRLFETVLPNCQTVSANGLNNHDGCHYGFADGYELLGHQMSALIGRDFYGSKRQHINAPTIKSCVYSNADQSEVTLEMKYSTDSIFADSSFTKLFRIEGDPSVIISSGFIRNNQVVLKLNKGSCNITGVTYDGWARSQPWVKGKTGMGLVSFYNIPIVLPRPPMVYTACKNEQINIGVKAISGCTYVWKELSKSGTYFTSKINVKAKDSTTYLLVTKYASTACVSIDSSYVTVLPDPIQVPELGKNMTICEGEKVNFKPEATGFSYFKWTSNWRTIQSFAYLSDTTQKIELTAMSKQGCGYYDTVHVYLSQPHVDFDDYIQVCPNQDTILAAPDGFMKYVWNDNEGNNTYRTSAGKVVLMVTDSSGCSTADSIVVSEFEVRESQPVRTDICSGNSVIIAKPDGIKNWYYKSEEKGRAWVVNSQTSGVIDILDSNACWSTDVIEVSVHDLPEFDLGPDTGYCLGEQLVFVRSTGEEFYWQGKRITSSRVAIDSPGFYEAVVTDSNGCSSRDEIIVEEYGLPSVTQFYDTTICQDSVWRMQLPDSITYTINGEPVTGVLNIVESGQYAV